MNTLRVCATIGLGLSLAVGAGCKSDSNATKKDAAPLDTRRTDAPGTSTGSDSASGPCVFNGTTYQPGQSFTVNCITYTCTGGDNVTGRGTACSDAGPTPDVARAPDLPTNRDTTSDSSDTRLGEAGAPVDVGSKDVQPGEAGPVNKDVGGKDTLVPDVLVPQDTTPPEPDAFVPEDTAPPSPDLPVVVADTAPPSTCSYGGQNYLAGQPCQGVPFACGTKTCECDLVGGAPVIVTIPETCAVDAQ
jgi:hypothetical protein